MIFETFFHVVRAGTIYQEEAAKIIFYDDRSVRQSYELPDKNQLILYDEIYDGFVRQYRKVTR